MRLDLENSPQNKDLVKQVLVALSERFSTDAVKVDTTPHDPSRILKAYLQAVSQYRLVVTEQDMLDSIELCDRMEKIREIHFIEDVPDRVGFSLAKIKHVVFEMESEIASGKKPEDVAMTRRQFVRACNASDANEEHYFSKAWNVYAPDYLVSFEVTGVNHRQTRMFTPR